MRTAVFGCLAMFVLSACGGSPASSPPAPKVQPASSGQLQPGSGQRHIRSTGPCTPDSYGYCLYRTGDNLTHGHCYTSDGMYQPYTSGNVYFTLYYNGDADGNYTEVLPPGCSAYEVYWTPDDPASATGDPNLP